MEEELRVRLPARFLSVGQCVARAGWVHPDRTIDSSVLIAVESGCLGIAVERERFVLEARQAMLLPAGRRHAGFPCAPERPPRYYWSHFADGPAPGSGDIRLRFPPVSLSEVTYNRLVNGFHQLISESSGGGGAALTRDYLLSLLLLELQGERRQTPRAAVANRMFEYIRLHCYEKLTLCDLARALGYSEDYLSRLFHESVDCSFRQYLHRLRMQRAKKELLSSSKTVQQIAGECGYGNAKFFSTAFLKCEGVTPTAYRNLYGGLHQNNA